MSNRGRLFVTDRLPGAALNHIAQLFGWNNNAREARHTVAALPTRMNLTAPYDSFVSTTGCLRFCINGPAPITVRPPATPRSTRAK